MTSCARARDQLALFVGGDLADAAADAVRGHLMSCRACRSEAASLQQATAALRSLGGSQGGVQRDVDDGMFAAMHRDIVAAVADADAARDRSRTVARRWLVAAAATLLAAIGFWLGHGNDEPSVWLRSPSTPVDLRDNVIVRPYAGEPLDIRPLSDEWWPVSPEDGPGQPGMSGMGVRLRLRTLVDERMLPQEPPR